MTDFAFPFQIASDGQTASVSHERHVRDLIQQVLFTTPGERVNRPDFGCDLLRLIFAPNASAVAQAAQVSAQGALQRWLGDLIQVEAVEAESVDSQLRVRVRYTLRSTRQESVANFTVPAP